MVEKVLSQELTGKKDLAFAEKFSIATANFFLNISNLYEATKEFAETMGISVEHADLWLKYIMSELETGLAGEKGGWSITYTLEKNDRTILEQELRNRFSASVNFLKLRGFLASEAKKSFINFLYQTLSTS